MNIGVIVGCYSSIFLATPWFLVRSRERELITRVAANKSFDDVDPAEIISIVNRYNTLDETRAIARDYADRARKALEPFPPSAAKEALEVALEFVLERDR